MKLIATLIVGLGLGTAAAAFGQVAGSPRAAAVEEPRPRPAAEANEGAGAAQAQAVPASPDASGGTGGTASPSPGAAGPERSAVTPERALVAKQASGNPDREIFVGVREDARPFSYRLNGLRRSDSRFPRAAESAYYDGYVARICGHVIAELERPPSPMVFVPVSVTASQRAKFLSGDDAGIDILCDPASITDERLEKLIASAPLYLSGITYASLPEPPERMPCGQLVGMVGGTTADEYGLRAILDAGEIPSAAPTLRAAMADPGGPASADCVERGKAANDAETYQKPAILLGEGHDQIAQAFCRGEIVYYVGDIEIVRSHLDAIPDCKYRLSAVTYRDERYAIFGRIPDKPEKIRAVLEFFRELSRQSYNQDSVLIESYDSTFPEATPSIKLKALFWSLTGGFPRRN